MQTVIESAMPVLRQGERCQLCGGAGVCNVGWAGLAQLGPGAWACVCPAGREKLMTYRSHAAQLRAQECLGAAEIPAKMAGYSFKTFEERVRKSVEKVKALRLAREWTDGYGAEHAKPWLFIFGRTGRGKTGLGVAALRALLGRGRPGRFVASFDMFAEMKSRFSGDVEAYTEALAQVEVLMLDEVVPVQVTDWRRGVLFELLARRDAQARVTIITTAAGTDELIGAVTEAGWRRIRENSVLVELGGNEINYGM